MGGGGRLPGAAREDVAAAPRCPSALETPPRPSQETPRLRRPRCRSGPSSPRCGPGRRPRQVSALPGAGAWRRPGWGTLLGLGSRRGLGAPPRCGRGLGLPLRRRDGSRRIQASPHLSHEKSSQCISPVGTVTGGACPQRSPVALQTGKFSWLVGARCRLRRRKLSQVGGGLRAPLEALAWPCFLVEEPCGLLGGGRRLEFGGLTEKFGNVVSPQGPPFPLLGVVLCLLAVMCVRSPRAKTEGEVRPLSGRLPGRRSPRRGDGWLDQGGRRDAGVCAQGLSSGWEIETAAYFLLSVGLSFVLRGENGLCNQGRVPHAPPSLP